MDGEQSDVPTEDKMVPKDAKEEIPMSRKESGEEYKSHTVSPVENTTSEAPSDQRGPNELNIVKAEKVEKLQSPPPGRSDPDDPAVSEPLENERFINNILSRLRNIRGKNE